MKKIFIIFSLLFCIGCQQSFLEIPTETHTHYTYYYTPKELFEKRITYYPSTRQLLRTFGGLKNLKYEGKIISAIPKDYYILVHCRRYDGSNKLYIDYENSILHTNGIDSSLEGKYLFTYKIEDFNHYIILKEKSNHRKDYIHWKFEKLSYFEKIDFIKSLEPAEFLILLEGLDFDEKLELLETLDELNSLQNIDYEKIL